MAFRHLGWLAATAAAAAVAAVSGADQVIELTTPITEVARKHHTFRAGIDTSRGIHRGPLRTIVDSGHERLEVATMPNRQLFIPRVSFEAVDADGSTESINLDRDLFHVGTVVGEPGSHVHLSVHPTGAVDGVVRRADGTKMVLSAAKRFSGVIAPEHHDTVVYNADDLTIEALHGMAGHLDSACPISGLNRSAVIGYNETERALFEQNRVAAAAAAANKVEQRRNRRATEHCDDTAGGKCSCSVALIGDHFFYRGPHAQQNVRYGIQHMVNVLIEADAIYRKTDFDGVTGLGLVVHSAVMYTTSSYPNPTPLAAYTDGTAYLNAVTNGLRGRFTNVCTSIVFTHRDFKEGILGMAWVAEQSGYGGVCDPMFNCGFNTGVNYGRVVSPFVAGLVFAHEIGHNLGAEHDPDSCSPGNDNGGNYIMFAAASDGSHSNNNQFSVCSTSQMSTVISIVREGCFVEAGVGCGDGEVNGDEECDCGDECTPTSCCTSDCRVNTKLYECSPQNPIRYPCCTLTCMYASKGTQCHAPDECAEEAFCNGTSASCPLDPRPDDTPCRCVGDDCDENPGTNPQVCRDGVCHAYICEQYNGVQCGLYDPFTCDLGCRGPGWGDGFECVSTFDESKTPDGFNGGRRLSPGTPCRKNLGRCDASGVCNIIDTEDGLMGRSHPPSNTLSSMPTFIGIASGIIVILGMLYFRQYRINQTKIHESERAHLLVAASAMAQADDTFNEHNDDLIDDDFEESDKDHDSDDEYAVVPIPTSNRGSGFGFDNA